MSRLPIALFALLVALLSQSAGAAGLKVRAVEVELVAREPVLRPGQALDVGLRIRHDPHWHTYWRNPGDSGLATEVHWKLPAGFAIAPIEWPAPSLIRVGPLANFGFEDEIVLAQRLQVPAAIDGERVSLSARADWLMCKDVCIPGTAELELVLPVDRSADAVARRGSAAGLFEAMASRRPQEGGTLAAHVQSGGVALHLPARAAAPGSVRFFPYATGVFDNPAAQPLSALDASVSGWRLQVAADPASTLSLDEALRTAGFFSGAAVGVLELDGQAFEVAARPGPELAGGTPVANDFESRVIQAPLAGNGGAGGGLFANAAARLGLGGGGAMSSGSRGGATGGATGGVGVGSAGAAVATVDASGGRPADAAPVSRGAGGSTGDVVAPGAGGAATSVPLAWALAMAVLGGLLLNLMPCVFPVIGLKVLGFAKAGGNAAAARRDAVAFAAGVLVAFWALALLLAALESAGRAAGWGFQLQSPVFIALMGLLFVAIGLNLAGVYEFGTRLTRLGALDSGRPGLASAFGSGLLAVVVATPCTAPFMGSALGLTLGEPLPRVLAVFTALGLGMSLPYLLLGLWPALLRRLPRPGPWMVSLRQFLAFPMFLTAVWLGWVLALQVDDEAWLHWALAAVLWALALWIFGRFGRAHDGAGRPLAQGLAVLVGALAIWLALPGGQSGLAAADGVSSSKVRPTLVPQAGVASGDAAQPGAGDRGWHEWSPASVAAAREQGRPVFVDFTAAWCVTCQVNKRLVLQRPAITERLAALEVLKLHADWTRMDEGIRAELARHGRSGVPLYLVYLPGEAAPRVLPEVLTPGIVLEAFAGLS